MTLYGYSFLAEAFNIGEVRTVVSTVDGRKLLGFRFANKSIWREFDFDADFGDFDWKPVVRASDKDDIHLFNYRKLLEKLNLPQHE